MMAICRCVSELFSTRAPYGCARGDDALWGQMRELSRSRPWPESAVALRLTIIGYFESIVGQPPVGNDTLFVPGLGTYGISGGQVSPAYWRDVAIPALEKAYLKRDVTS